MKEKVTLNSVNVYQNSPVKVDRRKRDTINRPSRNTLHIKTQVKPSSALDFTSKAAHFLPHVNNSFETYEAPKSIIVVDSKHVRSALAIHPNKSAIPELPEITSSNAYVSLSVRSNKVNQKRQSTIEKNEKERMEKSLEIIKSKVLMRR